MSDELRERNVAWYATMLGAFVSSRREKDKSLLALSTGGIGLLITLATTMGIPSAPILGLYAVAIGAFLVGIFYALRLFDLDAEHVESLLREKHDDDSEAKLKAADRILFGAFAAGVGFSILIGGAYAWAARHQPEEITMSEGRNDGGQSAVPGRRSLQGVANLKPANLPAATEPQAGAEQQPAAAPTGGDAAGGGEGHGGDGS